MTHKTILLAILGFLVFAGAVTAGYFGPEWVKQRRLTNLRDSFSQPYIPDDILKPFARHFTMTYKTSEPISLPGIPVLDVFNGKSIDLSSLRGQPILINFWATWCAPCVVEMPSLKRMAEHYKGRLKVVGVSLDTVKDEAGVRDFLEKRKLGDFAGYLDKGGLFSEEIKIRGIPTSLLIGSNGLILYRFEGDADWASPEAKLFFDTFLSTSAAANGE